MILEKNLECKALLFDLDGVLIDSTACIRRHWKQWAEQNGIEFEEIMRVAHGVRSTETIQIVAPNLDAESEAEKFTKQEIEDKEGVIPIDGAKELLTGLPMDTWAIVTSASLALATERLKYVKLPVPKHIVTADDVSKGKPNPEPYILGAKKLGIAINECIVIEDAPAGIAAGKAAGMQVIGIQETHSQEELLENGVDYIAKNLSDIRILETPNNDSRLRITIE